MDNSLLSNLEIALTQSPDNLALRFTLVQAYFDIEELQRSSKLLDGIDFNSLDKKQQLLTAKVLLAVNEPENALKALILDSPEINFTRAKAQYALNNTAIAKELYENSVFENPALEDIDFAKLLNVTDISPHKEKQIKLRVISNDNTDSIEVTRLIHPTNDKVTFADVGGLEQVKSQIRKKIITPFQKPSLFNRFRKKVGGGILLYGPPGCGKTLLARATAGECNAEFFNVVISDILDMYIGESERKLHAIFEQARAKTPAVIFFDEIEALAAKRQHTREATSSKLVSQFLSELDGFSQNNQGVLILGATNVPWALDPAFRRPGRFDRVVFVAPPDQPARIDILKRLLAGRPGGDSVDVEKLAKQTSGFSGADLLNLVELAVDEAIEESIAGGEEVPLNKRHIDEATRHSKSTALEWLTMARNYAKYANEAGQYDEVVEFLKKYGK